MTRGDIYMLDFGIPFGSEPGRRRPVVIIQAEMKKTIFIIFVILLICGCSKKNNETIQQNELLQESQTVTVEKPKEKEFRYVNSLEGLRIRDKPGTDGEKIGSLQNKEKVEVLSETNTIETIEQIKAKWIEIKTENDITGYVFGGFLEKDLETIDIIQNVEGEYKNKEEWLNVNIRYNGKQEFIVSVTAPFLGTASQNIKVRDIYREDLFYSAIDGRGGLDGSRIVKFDKDKNLIWKEDIYECEFDDDLNPINERETHNLEILEKVK